MISTLIRNLSNGANIKDVLPGIVFTIIVVLFSLSFHEFSHGYMSYKLGDPTARNMGRLTLNPTKHLDPIGTICMMLFGFGWAKPVQVNSRYYKKPRRDMALTALAGPISNIILSFFSLLILAIIISFSNTARLYLGTGFSSRVITGESIIGIIVSLIGQLLYYSHVLNLYLAVFNLIPIPPLDGSRILFIFLPDKYYFGLMKYERIIMYVMLALLWTGTLTLPLESICNAISNGMYFIIQLIPGL